VWPTREVTSETSGERSARKGAVEFANLGGGDMQNQPYIARDHPLGLDRWFAQEGPPGIGPAKR